MKICLTGASGFIGSAVVESILKNGPKDIKVLSLSRSISLLEHSNLETKIINLTDLSGLEPKILEGFDTFIHAAAITHYNKIEEKKSLQEYLEINLNATLNLARAAAVAGVKRFIFLSSIGVNGANSTHPFSELDIASPHDYYSLSKYEAELGLLDIASNTQMEVVVVRPPLVYGPGVTGSLRYMINFAKRSIPMPLRDVNNFRSLIALDNLVNFILLCADKDKSPNAGNEIFLISDNEDISTKDLFIKLSEVYGVKARIFSFPDVLLKLVAKVIGKERMTNSLLGNLQVDISKACSLLGWSPIINMDDQLKKMASHDFELKKARL